jgi:hypothetical protein
VLAATTAPTLDDEDRAAALAAFEQWCATAHPRGEVGRSWWRRLIR